MDKDKLSDNWRFVDGEKPLDEKTFDTYLEKYGIERALGYMEAIADIKAEVAWMLDYSEPDAGGWRRNSAKTAKLLRDFHTNKLRLIEHVLKHPVAHQISPLDEKLKQR